MKNLLFSATFVYTKINLYKPVISVPNLKKEYKAIKQSEKLRIIGDYGNEILIPIKVK